MLIGIFSPEISTGNSDDNIFNSGHVFKPEQETIDLSDKSVEDEDAIDVDIPDADLDNKNSNYEYYYVYYDEDGNVVDKSPPKTVNKAQDIPLISTTNINTNR